MTSFDPSAAMKFFVDGSEAKNLLARASFGGTNDPYFFAKPFTNHPRGVENMNECSQRTRNLKNAEASNFIFSTGTGHFSEVWQNGEEVPEGEEKFPFELIWVPNETAFPRPEQDEDFFTYFANYPGSVGDTLFTLYAWEDPLEGCREGVGCDRDYNDAQVIGEVKLTSELYRSTFGDKRLFFAHETFSRDFQRFN
jgi:hypothetical protein